MKLALIAGLAILAATQAPSPNPMASAELTGQITLPECKADTCRPADELVDAFSRLTTAAPDETQVLGHGNPWRLYDAEGRIQTLKELAEALKADEHFRASKGAVILNISWTGWAPPGRKSIAEQLGEILDRPVGGAPGFLWFAPDGAILVTRQAFTGVYVPYHGKTSEPVMPSAVKALPPEYFEAAMARKDSEAVRFAAESDDVFLLRPDAALAKYETAAELGDGIAAYNAALIRLDRGEPGDLEAARRLAARAVALRDPKAATLKTLVEAALPTP